MRRYILSGMPGCGKTSVIQELERLGHPVIHEAATDVIEIEQQLGNIAPWQESDFINKIIAVQQQRQQAVQQRPELQFYDRSPICTYALSIYLGFTPSDHLLKELDRIQCYKVYENKILFLDNLGFIENNDARKICFEEALKFEQIHLEVYKKFGYECITIPVASIHDRTEFILRLTRRG